MQVRSQHLAIPQLIQDRRRATQPDQGPALDSVLNDWPARPRLAVHEMTAKYGLPQGITSQALVWHEPGPYKRIMVTRDEIPHDFPKPHMDYLEHTIEFDVPAEYASEVVAFDGSITINRTAGEVSARCDLEGHNILTLNLMRDIVQKGKSAEIARREFGEIVVQDVAGKHPAYVEELQFEPEGRSARFPDEPVIPGSPERPKPTASADKKPYGGTDAEVLALVIALDENEVLAAAEVGKKEVRPEILEFARTLHQSHGKHAGETMELGQRLGVTPLETPAVDDLRVKGAEGLARLIPLDGPEFGTAYLDATVLGHTEAIDLIDRSLLRKAENEDIKQYLERSRQAISELLDEAHTLQESSSR